MGRRTDIDWEAIERDYRAGQLSLREIGVKHGVAASSITRRIEKQAEEGKPWTRDLTAAVQARTKALLASPPKPEKPKAERNAHEKPETQRTQHEPVHDAEQAAIAIEEAAATNVAVILSHRSTIAKVRRITDALLEELEAGAKTSTKGKKAPAEKRVTMVKSLSEAARIQINLERQAFSIAEAGPDLTDPLNALLSDLMKRRSAVPIVEEAE